MLVRKLLLLSLALISMSALAAPTSASDSETTWMKVLLDGRKIGSMQSTRQVEGNQVTTTERMDVTMDRAGMSLAVSTEERSIETRDGKPLGFGARIAMSGIATEIEGKLGADGKAAVVVKSGGRDEQRTVDWPPGAVLAEGAHLAERQHGLKAGTKYRVLSFQPSELSAVAVDVEVKGPVHVDIDGRSREFIEVDQRVQLPGAPLQMRAWIDADHELHKASMPLLGVELDLIACSKACAQAPNQSSDILEKTVVKAPRLLPSSELAQALRYDIRITGADPAQLPDTGEQRVTRSGETWLVEVAVAPKAPDTSAPDASEREPTRWIQSDNAEVIELARKATEGASSPLQRMQRLEDYVGEYISNKSMRVGYASALETLHSREGDCTEHALLLAAFGRAMDIPTRVVTGLAYAPAFAGYDRVFVPHAWVQAYVDGHWQSFDAALHGFDAGHIALSVGDGDASGFFAGVSLLGNTQILSADPIGGKSR